MSRYKDYRKPRRRRDDDGPFPFPEEDLVPSFFHQTSPATAKPVDAEVKWFNASKGFGFVRVSDGRDAYLHIRALEAVGRSSVPEGARLKVTLEETRKGHQVAQVLEIARETANTSTFAPESAGTVKWYNAEKGFGFIAPEAGGKDVFVHASTLARCGVSELVEGQKVFIECAQGKKGLEVQSIRVVA
ncbi:cold-shock protein [Mesorhizobium abyssinicae]|uniref:Cold-shock protein n=1 Tax=Mesorhizobium abyssinicae TaxID=1209958 RepID=A0ABU5AX03_9HYPH|nr:cold-shock protein [Mesorhizobium abyssinicae]MDX8541669.1 cold-shock protein [Mesorhizobium abyssinicae]